MPAIPLAVRGLLVLLLVVCGGLARAAGGFEHGLLWRVEAPGVAPSFLLGTLHSSDERVLGLAPPVRQAIDGSRSMAIELVDDEDAVHRFRHAMVTREPRLPTLLDAEEYDEVAGLLGEAGIPPKARAHFKPWAAFLVLVEPREFPGIQLDKVLLMDARAKGKPIHALETMDEQIAALDTLPPATQLALLRHALRRQEAIQLAVRPTVEAYLARDLGEMARLNAEAMAGDAAVAADNARFLDSLLYQRSARFAERLVPLLREGGVLAVFGALHLEGERGVPALLQRKGFRVTRVY